MVDNQCVPGGMHYHRGGPTCDCGASKTPQWASVASLEFQRQRADRLAARVAALEAAGSRMAEDIESRGPYDILASAEAWRALQPLGDREGDS